MKIPNYHVPNCVACNAMKQIGPLGFENMYCTGFLGKKQKRLPKSGIKRSVPSWCPKQISPPTCRVLGFVDDNNAMMEYMLNGNIRTEGRNTVLPSSWRYKLRCNYPLGMTVKQFCEEMEHKSLLSIFPDIEFSFGEILEIDDGHKPYYFNYAGGATFIPAPLFDGKKVK